MTLVLAGATDSIVFQVSDRRLTMLTPPGRLVDDERNKAVVVDGRLAIAYSGLAEICGIRTDLWLAEIVARWNRVELSELVQAIANSATRDFSRMQIDPRWRRHAFHGVGWYYNPSTRLLVNQAFKISNAIDERTGSWLPAALPEFRTWGPGEMPLNSGYFLESVGSRLHPSELGHLRAIADACVRRPEWHAPALLQGLARGVRELSQRYDTIGPGVMAISLPRLSVETADRTGHSFAIVGRPEESVATFWYVTATGIAEALGPVFVNGSTIIKEFRSGSGPYPGPRRRS
jgi:hypothetical protein